MSGIQTEPAAFRATYSDWKLIRTRKCVQLVFEVPIEESNKAYEVLGGMPNPASEIWCAVARLVNPAEEEPAHQPPPSAISDKVGATRNKIAQRIGILCSEPIFQKFLCWKFGYSTCDKECAAATVRDYCWVKSRSEIIVNTDSSKRWNDLYNDFAIWRDHPELAETEAGK